MVASACSPPPAVDSTTPRPKASWLTRSPGASDTTTRLPGDLAPGRVDAAAMAGVLDGFASARCHDTPSSGSSSRKREAGLYDGDPQALRITARETYKRSCARVIPT